MKNDFIMFTLASRHLPEQPERVAINPAQVAAVHEMGNTDTVMIGMLDSQEFIVMGTFAEVLERFSE